MEYMPEFSVLKPTTTAEAARMLNDQNGARILAGGTDLLVNIRRGIEAPQTLIDISAIDDVTGIACEQDGTIRIGSGVTLNTLVKNPSLPEAIVQAAAEIAAKSHQNMATVGGNLCLDTRCVYYNQSEWWRNANAYCLKSRGEICHVAPKSKICFAAFSGDLAPALLVHHADIEILGPDGIRSCQLDDLYNDDGADHLRLQKNEMLTAVILPASQNHISGYGKARVRNSIDFPLAGVAVRLSRDGDTLSSLDIALTGVSACPVRLSGTDQVCGQVFGMETLDRLSHLLPKQIQPMTSTMTPPGYRRKVANNLMRNLVERLFAG